MKRFALIKEIFILTMATIIIGAAVFFFLMPSHATVSSIAAGPVETMDTNSCIMNHNVFN